MNKSLFVYIALLLVSFVQLAPLRADDLSSGYDWKQMKIGGGGYVVGMDISPTVKDLIYVRTDVSGAYRWNASSSSWKQLVTTESMPQEVVKYCQYSGVVSIVSAPKDPDIAYMAFDPNGFTQGPGHIFKSSDRGDHWVDTTFSKCNVAMQPNGGGRQDGERLAVDPNNTAVVYFGSTGDGLWSTIDSGSTWTKVNDIPVGAKVHGVNTIVFDKAGGTTPIDKGVRTNEVYVTVDGAGVFQTTDGGATWKNIGEGGPGGTGHSRDADLGPDRTYYVCFEKDAKDPAIKGSFWKYSTDGKWTDITPNCTDDQGKNQGGSMGYVDLAVDPNDGKHVVVMVQGGRLFNSTDGGATWTFHPFHFNSSKIDWLGKQESYWLSVGEILFDPYDPGKLWLAEGFGVWWVKDFTTPKTEWQAESEGIEEMCGNDVIAPPGGQPVAAMWDLGAFYFSDPDTYTAIRSQPYFMACWGLDWCGADPKFLAAVLQNNLGFPPHPKSAGFSTDGGLTWTRFAAIDNNSLPDELKFGVIAISANSTDHIVWCPSEGKLPYYTTDKGVTWKQSAFTPAVEKTALIGFNQDIKPLCADRVQPDTFYFYAGKEGLYRSTDGGATFIGVGLPVGQAWSCVIKAAPGHGNDLWFTGGRNNPTGLFHSTDGGTTWTNLKGLKMVSNFGFGKSKEDGGYPTLYAAGTDASNQFGMFRSTDQGERWDRICGYPLGIYDLIKGVDGDKNTFGVVYIGFNSTGFAYGKPNTPSTPATPPAPATK